MKYEISKKLLEAVMEIELAGFSIESGIIGYIEHNVDYFEMPLDTFFFKCKKWVLKQGFGIVSGVDGLGQIMAYIEELNDGYRCKDFFSASEQQAVFDACQWILEMLNETK